MHKISVMFRQILYFLRYLICILLVAKIIHQNPMCHNNKITQTQIYDEYGLYGAANLNIFRSYSKNSYTTASWSLWSCLSFNLRM